MTDRRFDAIARNVTMAIGLLIGYYAHWTDGSIVFVALIWICLGVFWPVSK